MNNQPIFFGHDVLPSFHDTSPRCCPSLISRSLSFPASPVRRPSAHCLLTGGVHREHFVEFGGVERRPGRCPVPVVGLLMNSLYPGFVVCIVARTFFPVFFSWPVCVQW